MLVYQLKERLNNLPSWCDDCEIKLDIKDINNYIEIDDVFSDPFKGVTIWVESNYLSEQFTDSYENGYESGYENGHESGHENGFEDCKKEILKFIEDKL